MQGALMKLDGVKRADVDWRKGEAIVEYDPRKVTASQMLKAVNDLGVFKVKDIKDLSVKKNEERQENER
ncbi:MAG TPA: heavy metal-associated domain-containing protein [Candidatus Acidoferrales bacterium]|nr:heavy metal-associated domain-containing protein [Candidatus Acidoferrales bacterium]